MHKTILSSLNTSFNTKVYLLNEITNKNGVYYYLAETQFGDMTLIVELWHKVATEQSNYNSKNTISSEKQDRNKKLLNGQIPCPMIYEQHIVEIGLDTACLTLLQKVEVLQLYSQFSSSERFLCDELVTGGYNILTTNFQYSRCCYQLSHAMKSIHNDYLYFDFTCLQKRINTEDKDVRQDNHQLIIFKERLSDLLSRQWGDYLSQIIFIKELSCKMNVQAISNAVSWFDLALMFNLLPQLQVKTSNKMKSNKIGKLSGEVNIIHEGKTYQNYIFVDGCRIDTMLQLSYNDLKRSFFEQGIVYTISKQKYVKVHKRSKLQGQMFGQLLYDDIIVVSPQVSKLQFVNFLIAYLKEIEPILQHLEFNKEKNTAYIVFLNRFHSVKRVYLRFDRKYVFKDEELAIILEKSMLDKTVVVLREMDITDSFVLYLANSEKMSSIVCLDISYCSKITESAVNSLLVSPFCNNIQIFKACAIPVQLALLNKKKMLRQLHLNNCTPNCEEISFADLRLQRLQAIGVNIALNFTDSIQYLVLNCETQVDNLKLLKGLSLVQLRLRLVDMKKSVVNFITNIYSKDLNSVRQFAEGKSQKSLKVLDLSQSTIKWRDLKALFQMQSLQTLVLDDYDREKIGEMLSLPAGIVNLSFQRTKLVYSQLKELLNNISTLASLNVVDTDLKSNDVEMLVNKRPIGKLFISQTQASLKLFTKESIIKTVQFRIDKMATSSNEYILAKYIFETINNGQNIDFVCSRQKELLLQRMVHRFVKFHSQSKHGKCIRQCICINHCRYEQFQVQSRTNESSETIIIQSEGELNETINGQKILLKLYLSSPNPKDGHECLRIDQFGMALLSVIKEYPNSLLDIDIHGNRLMGTECIELISQICSRQVQAIDFRGCLFSFNKVQQELLKWPHLSSINRGEYEIVFHEHVLAEESQQYLKLFMKLSHEPMKLNVRMFDLEQSEIIYSVLYHILDHHKENISAFSIRLAKFQLNKEAIHFWTKLFELKNMKNLQLLFESHSLTTEEDTAKIMKSMFQLINNLPLTHLSLQVPEKIIPTLMGRDLKKLSLDFRSSDVTEVSIQKIGKGLQRLTNLQLNLTNCQGILGLSKVCHWIQRLNQLQSLKLQVQNCPLKQQSIFDVIKSCKGNILLQEINIDASFIIRNINELGNVCQQLNSSLRFCHIVVVAIGQHSLQTPLDMQTLLLAGIKIIL